MSCWVAMSRMLADLKIRLFSVVPCHNPLDSMNVPPLMYSVIMSMASDGWISRFVPDVSSPICSFVIVCCVEFIVCCFVLCIFLLWSDPFIPFVDRPVFAVTRP